MREIDNETGEVFLLIPTPELKADLDRFYDSACKHPISAVRRVTIANGQTQIRHQCSACGDLLGSPIKHTDDLLLVPTADPELRTRYEDKRKVERDALIQVHIKKQKERESSNLKAYDAYLLTAEWAEKRGHVLKRAGGICEGCRKSRATQAHHLTYKHIFAEFLFELVAVCDACHKRLHAPANADVEGTAANESGQPLEDEPYYEPPCCACRWQDDRDGEAWCFINDVSAVEALADGGPCGPHRSMLEGLK